MQQDDTHKDKVQHIYFTTSMVMENKAKKHLTPFS
jgi:hypothetical protein